MRSKHGRRAEKMWQTPRALCSSILNGMAMVCVDLINALAVSQQFTADDVWQQIRLAYEQN